MGRNEGLTLIETVFGLSILTIGVLGAGSALSTTLHLSREARESMIAAEDLQTAAELVRSKTFGTPGQAGSLINALPAGAIPQFNGLHLPGEQVAVSYYYWDTSGAQVPLVFDAVSSTYTNLPNPAPTQIQYQLIITWKTAVPTRLPNGRVETTLQTVKPSACQFIAGVRTNAE